MKVNVFHKLITDLAVIVSISGENSLHVHRNELMITENLNVDKNGVKDGFLPKIDSYLQLFVLFIFTDVVSINKIQIMNFKKDEV